MDRSGEKQVIDALKQTHTIGHLKPRVGEEGDVRYLTIETIPSEPHAAILNSLGAAGLMAIEGERDIDSPSLKATFQQGPSLKVVGLTEGSITFEDLNYRSKD